ncbi:MAG: hypothetical protein HW421_201 [Ignavibacteria bacterium]|nr:hypothetical protein [Ignavibacteria bacterium]
MAFSVTTMLYFNNIFMQSIKNQSVKKYLLCIVFVAMKFVIFNGFSSIIGIVVKIYYIKFL